MSSIAALKKPVGLPYKSTKYHSKTLKKTVSNGVLKHRFDRKLGVVPATNVMKSLVDLKYCLDFCVSFERER